MTLPGAMHQPWTPAHTVGQVLIAGLAILAYVESGADPGNSGIVEESIGGPAAAFVVALIAVAIPAAGVGVADGFLSRRRFALAQAIRAVAVIGLAIFAGLWVLATTAYECDSTCIDVPIGVPFASLAPGEIGVLGSWLLGSRIARMTRRT